MQHIIAKLTLKLVFAYSLLLIGTIKFYICSRKLLIMTMSFSDTKMLKNIPKHLVCSYLTRNSPQVMQAFADIL